MTASVRQARDQAGATSTAARLVWIGLPGPEVDTESAALIERGVGGVVLFSRNITGAEQLRRLTTDLRRRAAGPLRIAIDHEGGHIVRIGAPLTRFPSQMAIGAAGSEELAYAVARASGSELASLGVDVNLAPVLDVALDPRNASVGARSFGSSPEVVGRFGSAMVRGYRDAGIAATAKHFPGHGRTPVDPHLELPEVEGGLEALRRHDLPPFRSAIEAGVDLVMATHVAYEGLTGRLPSTLAAPVLRDLLRAELGFRGLTVSDAMNMGALTDGRAIPGACVAAIAAGVDVVMPLDDQAETVAALEIAISSAELPAARVAEALARSAQLDARLRADPRAQPVALPDADHLELARTVAGRSLTLLFGSDLLPLDSATSVAVIEFASRRPSPVEEEAVPTASVGAALRRHLPRVREVIVDGRGDLPEGERAAIESAALDVAGSAELVVLATRDAYLWPEEQRLIALICAGDRPTILIALRNPYDLARLPRTSAAAAVYADVPVTLEALADALTGRAGWPGTLQMDMA
jgi:beta-N-acetylhexosaminidase